MNKKELKEHISEYTVSVEKTDVISYKSLIGENGKKEIMVVFKIDGVKWTGEVLKVTEDFLSVYTY